MTKFAFEVPIRHLEDFEEDCDFLFALSFLLRESSHYREWMASRSKELWLDNSYNELMQADQVEQLCKLAGQIGADYIVCPDDPSWSVGQIANSYFEVCDLIKDRKVGLVAVVNSLGMYSHMMDICKAKHFAISYWVRITQTVDDYGWAKRCHFLGLLNPHEIVKWQPPSCDTSMPIKLALQRQTLDEWVAEGCPHIHTKDLPNFFNMKMNLAEVKLAKSNIKRLKEVCNANQMV